MKKLLLVLAAAFAMVACQTDLNEVNVESGLVDVTFEVGAPAARAYSDVTTATRLQYAIYDEDGNELTALTKRNETINLTKRVELKLVTGNTYTAIFWAAAPNAPYSVDWATGTMTVDYSAAVCNDENRDAFYKRHTFKVTGAQTETIELKRPFAQLNIGTNDYEAATNAGYTPTHSAVTVKNVYTTLDLWEGAVDGETEVNFATAEIKKDEKFPVNGYQYLAMNYLLVATEKTVVDVEFTYTDGADAKTRTVGSVPVQRNYRTNIYGQLLTSDVDINVEIKPEYDGEHEVESGNFSYVDDVVSLQAAIDSAPANEVTTIYLSEDIDLNATRALGYITRVENGSNIVIDGQGHTFKGGIRIVGQSDKKSETTVIRNINFFTEQNEIDFIASADFGYGNNYWRYANNVTVENCTFTAATLSADPEVVGVRFNKAYNVTVKNCEGTNLHSLAQFQSNDTAIVLEGLKAVNCKNGISLGTTKKVTINGLEIDAKEYGIRVDGNSLQSNTRCSLSLKNATIAAAQPIVARKVTAGYNLSLGENVVLNSSELHQVVFTTTSDDVRPYVAPAADKYTYSSEADFIVFPVIGNADSKVAEGLYYVSATKTFWVANAEGLIAVSADGTIKARHTVELIADIDLAGKEFNGLRTFFPEEGTTFDGKGHTVSNWTNESGASDMGFIREWVGPVKNVTIKNATLKTSGRSAIVAAKIYGNIENCHVVDCNIVDTYWACGLIAGLYNAGKIQDCTVTGSYVESNGGAGGIVGVINESNGNRGVNNCSVCNTTVNNKGAYGEGYSGGLICGMINVNNATIEFKGNTYENNTKLGKYVGDLYYNAEGNTIVTE